MSFYEIFKYKVPKCQSSYKYHFSFIKNFKKMYQHMAFCYLCVAIFERYVPVKHTSWIEVWRLFTKKQHQSNVKTFYWWTDRTLVPLYCTGVLEDRAILSSVLQYNGSPYHCTGVMEGICPYCFVLGSLLLKWKSWCPISVYY